MLRLCITTLKLKFGGQSRLFGDKIRHEGMGIKLTLLFCYTNARVIRLVSSSHLVNYKCSCLREYLPVLGAKIKQGSFPSIFEDRPMFRHIIQ